MNRRNEMRFVLTVLVVLVIAVAYIFIFALMKAADDEDHRVLHFRNDIPVQNITPVPAPAAWAKYPVPMDKAMQIHIVEESNRKGVSPAVVFAIIQTESEFDAGKIGDNGKSYGLMQIYASEHTERCISLNAVNLLDPFQNVSVGIDILAELGTYKMPLEWELMAYNGGMGYASALWDEGKVSEYAKTVKALAEQIAEGVMVCSE